MPWRLVCKGCFQDVVDKDDTYASTTLRNSMKLLLLAAPWKNYTFIVYDVSIARLHDVLKEELYVTPPVKFHLEGGTVWKPRNAMYCLKTVPKAW